MDKQNCSEMSNSEIKIYLKTLDEEFEAKKNLVKQICAEMDKIEKKYRSAEQELNHRKNIYT